MQTTYLTADELLPGDPVYERGGGDGRHRAVCRIEQHGERLTATIDDRMTRARSLRLELGSIVPLVELLERQRRAAGPTIDENELYEMTEHLLSGVYERVSARLAVHLDGLPRVALDLRGRQLAALPIETAHRYGEPGLFEITQLFRCTGASACGTGPVRRFELRFAGADSLDDLDLIALEQSLIHQLSQSGPSRSAGNAEALVHVAGHDPEIPRNLIDPDGRAHVVLSGCRSLPDRLPVGVASAVGSLWPVDEQSNTAIMAAYHSRLVRGIAPVEALRQAQLLNRHLAPLSWASYVHLGQPV